MAHRKKTNDRRRGEHANEKQEAARFAYWSSGCLAFVHCRAHRKRVETPNDPKLSDGGGWRGPCMAGGKAAAEARAVTAVAVRCSAWLGDG